MKKTITVLMIFFSAMLLLLFSAALITYAIPMKDASLDLSLSLQEDMLEYDPADYESKGWTVYTQEGATRTELEADGFGRFFGIELGQTFYFSRVLSEELDSPTLQIGAVENTYSVWLDEQLLYTDHPELDNRVGYLTLPMMGWFREEPIIISLPPDYQGKTLTIAQSFPDYSETDRVYAWPTSVKLYCGYAYESQLISESFLLGITAAAAFAVGVFLLIAFVRHRSVSLLCLALVAFLWMLLQLHSASFFDKYANTNTSTLDPVINLAAACVLLAYLALRAGAHRKVLWGIVAICTAMVAAFSVHLLLFPVTTADDVFANVIWRLPYWASFSGIVAAFVMSWAFWRRENDFYRLFIPLAAAAAVGYLIAYTLYTGPASVWKSVTTSLSSWQIDFVYHKVLPPFMIAALLSAVIETVHKEINLRTEKRLLAQRYEMTQANYDNMRLQNEEILMLRHDMTKHYQALYGMNTEEQRTAYLAELLGQNEKIRPVFQSGNEIIDIIMGSSMRAAEEAGVEVEIVRSIAPHKLPVSDADLCSLVMNLLDNAVRAAAESGVNKPSIRLDLHIKNGLFVFTCRNSASLALIEKSEKKKTAPGHGLGLRIVDQIAERNRILIETEYGSDYYEVTLAIAHITL